MEAVRAPTTAELVRAAYDLDGGLTEWFARNITRLRSHLDDGHGVYAAIYVRDPGKILHAHLDGAHPANLTLMKVGRVIGFDRHLPEGFSAGTATEVLGRARHARIVARFGQALGALDTCGISGPDGAGLRLVVAAPRKEPGSARARDVWLAKKVLPHIAAGLRLRRSLTGLALDTKSAEALFDPGGRCLNAQGMAEPVTAREALRTAVLEAERTRADLSLTGAEVREALVDGRWSLVERFDSDGRRFIVAYRNPSGVVDPRRLSPREREVCALLAEGTSQVSIAAQLGVHPSTVASVAGAVVTKLGLPSVKALPLFWRDAAGVPRALGQSGLVVLASAPNRSSSRLTRAERDILDGVLHGRSNREIAARRGTSLRTVANQLAGLLRKMRAGSRTELAAKALDGCE